MRNRTKLSRLGAGGRGPANHRRKGARGPADDDVLRRAPLQPHRIDEDVEGDGEGQQRAGHPIDDEAEGGDRADGEDSPEGEGLIGRDVAARDGPAGRALHQRVDIGVVPHVEGAGGTGADGDADERDDADCRMRLHRRQQHADQRREHHERHHARLHQSDEVADAAADGVRRFSHIV